MMNINIAAPLSDCFRRLCTSTEKPVDEPSHADYVPIVIQTSCSWGEHPLLCPSSVVSGLSRVTTVPGFSWVGSSTFTPCSPFCDPDSLFTLCAISVFISRSSSDGSYSSSTSSNTSCISFSSFSAMLTNK